MSFDALTLSGLLIALISGGFLVGVVSHNDRSLARRAAEGAGSGASATLPES